MSFFRSILISIIQRAKVYQAKLQAVIQVNRRMVLLNGLVLVAASLLLSTIFVVKPAKILLPAVTPLSDPDTTAAAQVLQTTEHGQTISSSGKSAAGEDCDQGTAETVWDKPWLHEMPQRPLSGKVILAYGWQIHPTFGDWRCHMGMDIEAQNGQRVAAMLSGVVTASGEDNHTGLTVAISSGEKEIVYGSLSRTPLKVGQKVSQGEVIGFTGQSVTEPYPHLHVGLKVRGDYQDPAKIF